MSLTTNLGTAAGSVRRHTWRPRIANRNRRARVLSFVFMLAAVSAVLLLALLLGVLLLRGWDWIRLDLFTEQYSRNAEDAGLQAAILGSILLVAVSGVMAFIIGVGTALFMEEYAPKGRITDVLQTNISNLAGVPSVVYGLLGLALFVEMLNLGRVLLAGALTMGLLILPIVIIASQEAIRNVPLGLRQAAFGVGATRWQVIHHHVLPAAMPGILTGTILAISRAIGETAPLIVVGASAVVFANPDSFFDQYTAMPMQIYQWAKQPQEEFTQLAAAAIIVLMVILLTMNGLAIYLRERLGKDRW
ncbi:MAG TPA: phosphate ABC transporter permease PstA [Thermomicrobiales bacterium]|nr:phosphate ABC transporter permease PstA [Thermomicrobiales bacterium]